MDVDIVNRTGLININKRYSRGSVTLSNKGKSKGVITGKVLEQGTPVSRRVLCHQRDTGVLVGSTWSDVNGDYIINGLDDSKKYYVVSLDEDMSTTQYNAVVQDLIPTNEVLT